MRSEGALAGSFRDPAGYVFLRDGVVLRALREEGDADWQLLNASGLYAFLVEKNLLLAHDEMIGVPGLDSDVKRVLRPEQLPFYSFPYEWSFSQLRDAALLTLRVLRLALKRGMTLKDASAYNVSFLGAQPVFADILSFTRYEEDAPWQGYLQFCEQFFVPLLLSRRAGRSVSALLRAWHDGVPLPVGARLLRGFGMLRPAQLMHVHLHARSMRRNAAAPLGEGRVPRQSLQQTRALVDSLERAIRRMKLPQVSSAWTGYYDDTVYDAAETREKEDTVRQWTQALSPATVWDLGSNTGRYARIAAEGGAQTLAMDADDAVVDSMYRELKSEEPGNITPLVMNLANPSSGVGWAHEERPSLADRGPADLVLYLGLLHHLRYTHMLPLEKQAAFLARIARHVILEWIPPEDPNVRGLAVGSRANFAYSRALLISALESHFDLRETKVLGASGRELMLLVRKGEE